MLIAIKQKFKSNPLLYYALSICATWAGIGSLMNGVAMTQTYGIVPSLIWVLGNTFACILFGLVALKIPKVREVFNSRIMKWICGIMCVFQAWLSMNGMQTVFADTVLGETGGMVIAYGLAVFFLIILLRFGMIRNVLTDGFGWLVVYALAVGITVAALIHSRGHLNTIGLGLEPENMRTGIWKAILLLLFVADAGKIRQQQLGPRAHVGLEQIRPGVKGFSWIHMFCLLFLENILSRRRTPCFR